MAKEKDLQKIQQASGVTSDTTVRMVDASGNSVQIDRDVFMQAIRDVLPSVLSDQGTNATKVSTLNSSNVLGTSTIANLASALGGVFHISQTTFFIRDGGSYEMTGLSGCWILLMTTNQWDISAIVLVSKPAFGVKVLGYHGGGSKTVGTESTNDVQFIHDTNSETVTVKSNDLSRTFRVTIFGF